MYVDYFVRSVSGFENQTHHFITQANFTMMASFDLDFQYFGTYLPDKRLENELSLYYFLFEIEKCYLGTILYVL